MKVAVSIDSSRILDEKPAPNIPAISRVAGCVAALGLACGSGAQAGVDLRSAAGRPDPAATSSAGEAAFDEQCASCHRLDGVSTPDGPPLNGVVWRKIAGLADFRYSAGLRTVVGTWTPDRLDAYLRNTQAFAPGTDMFWDIGDGETRRAIIRYLESTK